ncbi:MAG: potassium-transporting ATPase subunit KdpB, partial [candidate division Zixibacteria bacterium]|nr:potassium-transporting ATPase subunit KdpB [candidate division Zixibacteria bacterium]
MAKSSTGLFDRALLGPAIKDSFRKLHPRTEMRNPVMFVAFIGAILTTVAVLAGAIRGSWSSFDFQISLWLWFTVLFANFAEAMAEGRGKAQAESLRKTRSETTARKLTDGREVSVAASCLKKNDVVVCKADDIIPSDGEVIEGIASVDESAITGESAPVIRESGGDRSAVTGGTRVISDRIVIRITSEPGNTFIDRMIELIEGAKRQKTPNEIALSIVLAGLTIIFLLAVATLKFFADYSGAAAHQDLSGVVTVTVLVSLLVCLIPTTIGALLSAIGIAGIDRLVRRNVIAKSGRAVEAAGDIDVLLLDKTGTITLGNRMATEFIPASMITAQNLAEAAQLASLADETPEGRSIVILSKDKFGFRAQTLTPSQARFVPFSAQTRISGVDVLDTDGSISVSIRKGAIDSMRDYVIRSGGQFPDELESAQNDISRSGGTPLAVSIGNHVIGVVHLKDIVKGGIKDRFADLRRMGIRTVMMTGDNPLTAAAIAAEAGVDDFIAQAT